MFEVLSWFWLLVSSGVILWVGNCIRFESLIIVRLCVFCTVCTVSSESSDVFCIVAVSEGFICCISETCGTCGFVMMLFQVFYIECNIDKSHNVLLPME